jgi:hypothetical protein
MLKVEPNMQAMYLQQKVQIKTLSNKLSSFIDETWLLDQVESSAVAEDGWGQREPHT